MEKNTPWLVLLLLVTLGGVIAWDSSGATLPPPDTQQNFETQPNFEPTPQPHQHYFSPPVQETNIETDEINNRINTLFSRLAILGAAHNENAALSRKLDNRMIIINTDWSLNRMPTNLKLDEKSERFLGENSEY